MSYLGDGMTGEVSVASYLGRDEIARQPQYIQRALWRMTRKLRTAEERVTDLQREVDELRAAQQETV